ncbi:hypothetical protein BASA81_017658 [Batrachochytrium salamandrivorans]|nr:hypothetical protein BASA81_017658 [Batrachochytrium salamandrivorans]
MKATFGEINQEQVSETKLRALRQGNQPCAIYAAEFPPDFLNGDKSSSTTLNHSDAIHLQLNLFLASTLNSTNIDMLITLIVSQCSNLSPTTATPTQQRPTSDDMDIDFVLGVAPSVFQTDSKGLVKDSALFVVSQDIFNPPAPV